MNTKRIFLSLTVATLMIGTAQANPQVYEKALRSTAFVVSPLPKEKDKVSWGTGSLVDAKRKWVVTNYHVVEDRDKVLIFFPSYQNGKAVANPEFYLGKKNIEKQAIQGKVLVRDKKHDLALIELKTLPAGVPEMALAARSPRPGETVHAIGNSGLQDGTLWRYSRGEVRQVYQAKLKSKIPDTKTILETDYMVVETQAPTNPGDSGGPVLNERGELVAITQSHDTQLRLVSFSVEIGDVRAFLRSASGSTTKDKVVQR